ncbi:DUF3783 domain-containing protein [Youngiibacter multivorans]|uniref:DUF3783 domain-containing protein n=1 Tax=Youngiibacter multivorans TaxID=937251 RepID=A0ABS4FZK8_9CLOT|nr:DUF3783 domain-containing protein [Youngiibacter multivorans]MBP1917741.1 hypothetical protein [Youngiibacter multivorans]
MREGRVLLVHGLSELERNELLGAGFSLDIVDDSNAGGTLEDILEGRSVRYEGKPHQAVKIIIFYGYETNDELKEAVVMIRKNHVYGAIMAVVTENSYRWKFSYLIEHLIEEREENRKIEQERRAREESARQ